MNRSVESSKHTVCLLALFSVTIWVVLQFTLQLEAVGQILAGGLSALH